MEIKPTVLFRADADKKTGFGHFVRTLALADMLKDDFECVFYTAEPTAYQIAEISKICKCESLREQDKLEYFLSILRGNEIVWLDNYFFSSDYQKQIVAKGCKLVCIGLNDKHYYANVVINYFKDPSTFESESYTQFCVGMEWCLLRKEFLSTDDKKINLLRNLSMVICIGGTDQFLITEKVISVVRSTNIGYHIHVIATDAFGLARIEKLIDNGIQVHLNASAKEIADMFLSSSFAVVSASTVAQEALACNLKVLAGYYVSNQKDFYDFLEARGYIIPLGNMMSPCFETLLMEKIVNLDNLNVAESAMLFKNTDLRYKQLFKSLSHADK